MRLIYFKVTNIYPGAHVIEANDYVGGSGDMTVKGTNLFKKNQANKYGVEPEQVVICNVVQIKEDTK